MQHFLPFFKKTPKHKYIDLTFGAKVQQTRNKRYFWLKNFRFSKIFRGPANSFALFMPNILHA